MHAKLTRTMLEDVNMYYKVVDKLSSEMLEAMASLSMGIR